MRGQHKAVALGLVCAMPFTAATAQDPLLETLARKGVLSADEYDTLQAQRKSAPTVDTADGFRINSADGAFSFQPGTLQQIDFAWHDADLADLADGSEARRSRLSASGSFLRDWEYRVEYEFSGTNGVTDAYVAYSGYRPLVLTGGQFKQPFGMEATTEDKSASFMERGLPFAFITTRAPGLMAGSSGRNWSARVGLFGEPLGSAAAGDEGYAAVGRARTRPAVAFSTASARSTISARRAGATSNSRRASVRSTSMTPTSTAAGCATPLPP